MINLLSQRQGRSTTILWFISWSLFVQVLSLSHPCLDKFDIRCDFYEKLVFLSFLSISVNFLKWILHLILRVQWFQVWWINETLLLLHINVLTDRMEWRNRHISHSNMLGIQPRKGLENKSVLTCIGIDKENVHRLLCVVSFLFLYLISFISVWYGSLAWVASSVESKGVMKQHQL